MIPVFPPMFNYSTNKGRNEKLIENFQLLFSDYRDEIFCQKAFIWLKNESYGTQQKNTSQERQFIYHT